MPELSEVVKESLCSALYSLPFSRFLGERDQSAYFRLYADPTREKMDWRTDPKFLMVEVSLKFADEDFEFASVVASVSCINVANGEPLRVSRAYAVTVHDALVVSVAQQATEDIMVRVLEDYQGVLGQIGLAGPMADLAPESAADDEPEGEDLAVDWDGE